MAGPFSRIMNSHGNAAIDSFHGVSIGRNEVLTTAVALMKFLRINNGGSDSVYVQISF